MDSIAIAVTACRWLARERRIGWRRIATLVAEAIEEHRHVVGAGVAVRRRRIVTPGTRAIAGSHRNRHAAHVVAGAKTAACHAAVAFADQQTDLVLLIDYGQIDRLIAGEIARDQRVRLFTNADVAALEWGKRPVAMPLEQMH